MVANGKIGWGLLISTGLLSASCSQQGGSTAATAALSGPAATCASLETVAQIKSLVFDEAQKAASGATKLILPKVAEQSQFAIKLPVLDSADKETRKISCSGRIVLTLPAGILQAGGSNELTTDVKYSAQPSADGTGTVYSLLGSGELSSALASADVVEWSTRFQPTTVAQASPSQSPANPVEEAGAETTTTTTTAENTAAEAPPPRPSVSPSFDCSKARRFDEATICQDPELVMQDLRLAALYRRARASDVSGEFKDQQRAAWNQRSLCATPECVKDWYSERLSVMSAQ